MAGIILSNPNTGSVNPTNDVIPVNDNGTFIDSLISSTPATGQTVIYNLNNDQMAKFDAANDVVEIGNPANPDQVISQGQTGGSTFIKDPDSAVIDSPYVRLGSAFNSNDINIVINNEVGTQGLQIDGANVIRTITVVPTGFSLRFIHAGTTFYIPLFRA